MANANLRTFAANLRSLRRAVGLSQEALAHAAELDRTYISMLERAVRNPTLATLESLAGVLQVPVRTLLEASPQANHEGKGYTLPLYGTEVSCGKPFMAEARVEKRLSLDEWLIRRPDRTYFVRAAGASMEPTICAGDLLVVERTTEIKSNEIGIFRVQGDFAAKRAKFLKNRLVLESDNPKYGVIHGGEDADIEVCGVVRGIVRKDL